MRRSQAESAHTQYIRGLTQAQWEVTLAQTPSGPPVPKAVPLLQLSSNDVVARPEATPETKPNDDEHDQEEHWLFSTPRSLPDNLLSRFKAENDLETAATTPAVTPRDATEPLPEEIQKQNAQLWKDRKAPSGPTVQKLSNRALQQHRTRILYRTWDDGDVSKFAKLGLHPAEPEISGMDQYTRECDGSMSMGGFENFLKSLHDETKLSRMVLDIMDRQDSRSKYMRIWGMKCKPAAKKLLRPDLGESQKPRRKMERLPQLSCNFRYRMLMVK